MAKLALCYYFFYDKGQQGGDGFPDPQDHDDALLHYVNPTGIARKKANKMLADILPI